MILNTTKISDFKVTQKFKDKFKIYKVTIKENEYSVFFKELNKIDKHVAFFKNKDTVYILSENDLNINDHKLKETPYEDLKNHILINLALRTLPYLTNNNIFSLTDNLTYFYSIKEGNIREYLSFDINISEKMVMSINGATYSSKLDLEKKLALLKNINLLQKLKRRTVYFEDNGKILKLKNKKGEQLSDEVTKLVKMKLGNTKNTTKAVSLDASDYLETKSGCLFYLMKELNTLIDYFTFEFDTIQGKFVTRKTIKDSDVISRKNSDLDYTKHFDFFKDKKIGVINYSNDSSHLINLITELDIFKIKYEIKLLDSSETDFNIILSHSPEYYEKNNIKDPYETLMSLKNHFINVDKHKVKNYKNIVQVILKELMIKSNLLKKELFIFGCEHDSTLINLNINIDDGIKTLELTGINIVNNKIKILTKDIIFKDSTLANLLESKKILNKINDSKNFFIFSFGGKCDGLLFENIYLVSAMDEIAIPNVNMIGQKIDKKELLSRSMKNNGKGFPFAGVYGLFYNHENNNIRYYVGSLNPQPQSKISKFCTLYNAEIIQGSFDYNYFCFFEHFYVKNKDSTTLPFTFKYLRESLKYNIE